MKITSSFNGLVEAKTGNHGFTHGISCFPANLRFNQFKSTNVYLFATITLCHAMSSLIENSPLFVGSRLSRPVPHLTVIGLRPQLPHCSCDFWHFSTRPRGTQKHEVRWHCIAVGDHKISKFSVSSFLVLCLNHPYLLFPFCFGPHSRCCEKCKRLEPSPGQCNPASVPGCRSCPES